MVYVKSLGSRPSTILFKYLAQWLRSARILRRQHPDAVFVMTPPVFAALPAFWYARRSGGRVVLDAHTAAFLHPRWRKLQWLQKALCRRAATTLVSNAHLADLVRASGAHATIVGDVPVIFPEIEPFQRPREFMVAVICSFNYDEPVDAIVEAAERLPDVRFFVTGNPQHLSQAVKVKLSRNVKLTGFLSTPAYGGLLQAADVVLTLTTRDHTMLRGAYEAIYQGTPVIVSDWPLLRSAFAEGALHVDNSAQSIVEAVRLMQRHLDEHRRGAQRLREHKLKQWWTVREAILARIGQDNTTKSVPAPANQ
jgi:glycosyltransferase involved in cell wall biosynthesis